MDIKKALKDGLTKDEILAAVAAEIDDNQLDEQELEAAREEYIEAQVRYYRALGRETDYDTVKKAVFMTEKYIKREDAEELTPISLLRDLFDSIKA